MDATLADVFSLLSLFYLTIGKTRDAPATYSQLASMRVRSLPFVGTRHSRATQQILEHMNESAVYSESDLAPFRRRLKDVRQIISQQSSRNAITKLLERQAKECDSLLCSMEANLSVLSDELVPIHERLVKLRRALVTLAAKEGSHKAELKPIAEELRKIDA